MPSPTRKSKNYTKNKTNKNRNFVPRGILDQPLFQAMNRGNVSWGDLMMSNNANHESPGPNYAVEHNALDNWSMPNLTMRKGIWENFPVVLKPLEDRNGTERFAIEWHRKHLKEWKDERSASMDEWMEYQAYAEFRLIHALRAHAHQYVIEPPRTKDQIVVIAMKHREPRVEKPEPLAAPHAVPRNEGKSHAVEPTRGPVLHKLNDIKAHFPVVWHPVDGHVGKSTYALELFGKKIREMSMTVGHDVTEEVKHQLMNALRASRAWHVLPAVGKELCRLEIA
jgi:hypothetical protein